MKQLDEAGFELAVDWTDDSRSDGQAWDEGDAHSIAAFQADQVARSDAFWLLIPEKLGFGCAVELGVAHHSRVRPIIVSGWYQRSIFTSLATKCLSSDSDALKYLQQCFSLKAQP